MENEESAINKKDADFSKTLLFERKNIVKYKKCTFLTQNIKIGYTT